MQGKVDMLIIHSDGGLYDDQRSEIEAFVRANTRIPTGSAHAFMAPLVLICYGKVAEEQGAWSAPNRR
jgi:hypothetical protein